MVSRGRGGAGARGDEEEEEEEHEALLADEVDTTSLAAGPRALALEPGTSGPAISASACPCRIPLLLPLCFVAIVDDVSLLLLLLLLLLLAVGWPAAIPELADMIPR